MAPAGIHEIDVNVGSMLYILVDHSFADCVTNCLYYSMMRLILVTDNNQIQCTTCIY